MLFKKNKRQGYLLVESLVALFLVMIILLQLIPLSIFIEKQRLEQQKTLEVYRYFSEIAGLYQSGGMVISDSKVSSSQTLRYQGSHREKVLVQLEIEMAGDYFEINYLSTIEE